MDFGPVEGNSMGEGLEEGAGVFGLSEYLIGDNCPVVAKLFLLSAILSIICGLPIIENIMINQFRIVDKEPAHLLFKILNLSNVNIVL